MTFRILEPSSAGHRLYYVRVLAEGCSQPVEWITTLEAANSKEAVVHLGSVVASGRLTVRILEPWPGKAPALRGAAGTPEDVVVVPDGDRWLPAMSAVLAARRPRSAYRLLLMRPQLLDTVTAGRRSRARRAAKGLLLKALSAAGRRRGCLEVFGLVDAFGYGADQLVGQVVAVADPVMPRRAAETPAEPAASLVVGLLGAVDERKNPGLLAAACRDVFTELDGRLIVVGAVTPEAAAALSAAGLTKSQLSVENRYVDEEELTGAAAICDVIALLYANHDSSSGVLALAAQVGTPVLVPQGSRLAATADRGGFGISAELTVEGVALALRQVRARGRELSAAAGRAGALLGTEDFVGKLAGPRR